MDWVTKILRVIGVLFFGYISLSMIGAIVAFQQEPDTPAGAIIFFLAVGIASGYVTRLLWRQLRAEKSITMAERVQNVKDSPIIKSVRSNLSISTVMPTAVTTLDDEAIYNQIADELADGVKKEGLWLKALEQANDDESKTLATYIKFRSQSILAEQAEDQEKLKAEVKRREEEAKRKAEKEQKRMDRDEFLYATTEEAKKEKKLLKKFNDQIKAQKDKESRRALLSIITFILVCIAFLILMQYVLPAPTSIPH